MRAIKLQVVIDPSRRLQLDLPVDTPAGEAEVIILISEDAASPSPATPVAGGHQAIDPSGAQFLD